METELAERLRAHSDYFLSMFSLVPAQYRVTREEDALEETTHAPGGKKARFWHLRKGAGQPPQSKAKRREREPSAEDASGKTVSVASSKQVAIDAEQKKSLSLSELRRRLEEKMEESSATRGRLGEKERSGRQRKRKRGREGDDGGPNKKQLRLEEKKKRKESLEKERKAKQKKAAVTLSGDSKSGSQFFFNRIEFSDSAKPGTKKNYKTLVAKAEAKQRKLQELVEQDVERGGVAVEKEKWMKAVRMARGEKVKDDPSLLRKTVKRLEKKKKTHVKRWKERVRAEQQRKETREKKRHHNIKERVDQIKAKKTRKRAKKKGLA